jgi:hypothetical protein
LSCSQATLSTVADYFGIGDRGTVKAALPLEGGGLNHGSTCGVVSGGCLAIALVNEEGLAAGDKLLLEETYSLLKDYTGWFEQRFGSTLCRDRIGTGLMTPGGIANYLFSGKAVTRCVRHAAPAAERLASLLGSRRPEPVQVEVPTSPGCCAAPVARRIRRDTGAGDEFMEVISMALDGGVGLSGGICGALSVSLMAAGTVWGTDPATTGSRGAVGSLVRTTCNAWRSADKPGLWSAERLVNGFYKEFSSLECRDIARPFESGADLAKYMQGSDTCARAINWCAATATDLIRQTTTA